MDTKFHVVFFLLFGIYSLKNGNICLKKFKTQHLRFTVTGKTKLHTEVKTTHKETHHNSQQHGLKANTRLHGRKAGGRQVGCSWLSFGLCTMPGDPLAACPLPFTPSLTAQGKWDKKPFNSLVRASGPC